MKGHSPKRGTLAAVGTAMLGALLILLVPAQPAISDGGFLEFERILPVEDPPAFGLVSDDVCDRQIVNVRDTSFTIVWATSSSAVASVLWGPVGFPTTEVCDDRDGAPPCDTAFGTHFMTITGLSPGQTYDVQPRIDGVNSGDVIQITTGTTIPGPTPFADTTFGLVGPDSATDPPVAPFLTDVYVCATIVSTDGSGTPGTSEPECSLIQAGGSWSINLADSRTNGYGSYFTYSLTDDEVLQEACGAGLGCDEQQISTSIDGIITIPPVNSPTLFLDSAVCTTCIPTGNSEALCDGIDDDCDGEIDEEIDVDLDGDGFGACSDCDDDNFDVNPGATEIPCDTLDNDCDTGTTDTPNEDGDAYDICGDDADCDDTDSEVNPGAVEVTCDGKDNDCEGATPDEPDVDGDGFDICGADADCDDTAETVNPAATEATCDGIDNDCNVSTLDEPDVDGDGFDICGADADCDDTAETVNPGATEATCDTVDNDCDPLTLDDPDGDGDGFGVCSDCDDGNPAAFPGAAETVGNGIDEDCSGADACYLDSDDDGFGNADGILAEAHIEGGCEAEGVSLTNDDCDDSSDAINPGATESTCNGVDDDCNASTEDSPDADGDGFDVCGADADCNDIPGEGAAINPAAEEETCNGIDDDCNGATLDDPPDGDTDGQTVCEGDCDDGNDDIYFGNPEVTCDGLDNDCDGATLDELPDLDGDGFTQCTDCNDIPGSGEAINPGAEEIECDGVDNDCNVESLDGPLDGDGDNVTVCQGDCDDTDGTIFPGATEVTCDTIDNDCDPLTLDGPDADGDGVSVCTDCDDADSANYPGNTELCDGQDNDCNTLDDFGTPGVGGAEADADGDFVLVCGNDCDDTDPANFPGNTEICDGQDNDCNDLDDAGNAGVGGQESDGDGDGQWECAGDCDDNDSANFTGNTELCDGQDNDCNGLDDFLGFDESETDNDGDGQSECGGDCDDNDSANYTGNTEVCDGQDNDCNDGDDFGGFDDSETDNDGDGQSECQNDCDDANAANYTGNTESCDGQDNDCNGLDDAGNAGVGGEETDNDGDGQSECAGDCDDADAANYTGNTESCDGQDNDCNGLEDAGNPGVDGQEFDDDGDGLAECDGDCDDADPAVNPGAEEICEDEIDNNCDGEVNEFCAAYFSTRDDVYLPGNLHVHPEGVYSEDDGTIEQFAAFLPDGINLDALDLDGPLTYFSVRPGGTVANPDSSQMQLYESVVYVHDTTTGFISEHLNLGDWGLAVDDLCALDLLGDGSVAFSTDTVNNLDYNGNATTLYPGTLYRLTPTALSVLLDGADVGGLDDLDAADVQANGTVLFSPATTQFIVNQGSALQLYDANIYKLRNNGRIVEFYNAAADGLDTIDAYCFGGAEYD